MTTVWIYEKADVLMMFDTAQEASDWLAQNDPDGEAIKHTLGPLRPAGSADMNGVPRATETRSRLRVVK
jgi:hypothetical protein